MCGVHPRVEHGVVTGGGACSPPAAPVAAARPGRRQFRDIRDGGFAVLPLGPFYARFASSRLARVFMRFPPQAQPPVRHRSSHIGARRPGRMRAAIVRRPMVRPHPDELARIGATRRIGASGVGVYVTFSVFGTDTPPPLPVHDAPRCRLNRLCSEPPILHGRAGHSLLSLNTHHPPN